MLINLLLFFIGALTWTLAEYLLHRFLGHDPHRKNTFSVEHLAHHADVSYFAPTTKKVASMGTLAAAALPLLFLGLGVAGLMFGSGFFVMYVLYEVIHRRLHSAPGNNRYGRWARRHHLHHHYRRPKMNHGVTSPLWDFVFRTLDVPEVVRVPRRNALPWMLDEAGELNPKFAGDYKLVGRKPKSRGSSQ